MGSCHLGNSTFGKLLLGEMGAKVLVELDFFFNWGHFFLNCGQVGSNFYLGHFF